MSNLSWRLTIFSEISFKNGIFCCLSVSVVRENAFVMVFRVGCFFPTQSTINVRKAQFSSVHIVLRGKVTQQGNV